MKQKKFESLSLLAFVVIMIIGLFTSLGTAYSLNKETTKINGYLGVGGGLDGIFFTGGTNANATDTTSIVQAEIAGLGGGATLQSGFQITHHYFYFAAEFNFTTTNRIAGGNEYLSSKSGYYKITSQDPTYNLDGNLKFGISIIKNKLNIYNIIGAGAWFTPQTNLEAINNGTYYINFMQNNLFGSKDSDLSFIISNLLPNIGQMSLVEIVLQPSIIAHVNVGIGARYAIKKHLSIFTELSSAINVSNNQQSKLDFIHLVGSTSDKSPAPLKNFDITIKPGELMPKIDNNAAIDIAKNNPAIVTLQAPLASFDAQSVDNYFSSNNNVDGKIPTDLSVPITTLVQTRWSIGLSMQF